MKTDTKFTAVLEWVESLTVEGLEQAISELPADLRERLAQGPMPHRWSCGVCAAFGSDFYANVGDDFDPTDARWLVWAYHEAPKLHMTRYTQLHYGPLADETYERCLATYRAAGWTGEAPPPDA